MRMHLSLSLFLFVIFLSCKSKEKNEHFEGYENAIEIDKITSVNGNWNSKNYYISVPKEDSLFFDCNKDLKDINYIQLESVFESKIYNVDKLFITDTRIYVIDNTIVKAAYIFDSIGKFIGKIENSFIIKTPEQTKEGFSFEDVAYDFNKNELILHDGLNKRLLYFDSNGKFLRFEKTYIYFTDFANIRNTDNYVYYSVDLNSHIPQLKGSGVYLGKANTKILHVPSNANSQAPWLTWKRKSAFSSLNSENSIYYIPPFSDTIFEVNGQTLDLRSKLIVQYPGPSINAMIKNNKRLSIDQLMDSMNSFNYYHFGGDILSTNDSIYFLNTKKTSNSGYFFSTFDNSVRGGQLRTENADSILFSIFAYPIATYKNYFVSLLPASGFARLDKNSSAALKSLNKTLKSTDNPVLAFYKLKN